MALEGSFGVCNIKRSIGQVQKVEKLNICTFSCTMPVNILYHHYLSAMPGVKVEHLTKCHI